MIEAKCHCGNITLRFEKLLETITSCNCSSCHRLGALWAYYTADQVEITQQENSNVYLWGNKLRSYHVCPNCGCTTHYTQKRDDGTNRVAINTRMADPELYKSVPVRYFDGAESFKFID